MLSKKLKRAGQRISLLALLIIGVNVLAQEQSFVIKGKTSIAHNGRKLYMFYRTPDTNIKDSTVVSNGQFQFHGRVSEPTPVTINFQHSVAVRQSRPDNYILYIESGDVYLNFEDSIQTAVLTGNKLSEAYVNYRGKTQAVEAAMQAVDAIWMSASQEEREGGALMNELKARVAPLSKQKMEIQEAYIKQYPDEYFSLLAIRDIAGATINLEKIVPLYDNLSPRLKASKAGLEFANRIEASKKTAIGQMAPDFEQPDVQGKPVKLSDFRGQYVLLDFWASWCGPCRDENPHVLRAYNKFKNHNFTVLGVSLDKESQKKYWLEAIEKDQLPWTQLSDLKGGSNEAALLYGIRAIPQNFLIDPSGKIVAKNLRGDELSKTLADLIQ